MTYRLITERNGKKFRHRLFRDNEVIQETDKAEEVGVVDNSFLNKYAKLSEYTIQIDYKCKSIETIFEKGK